MYSIGVNNSAVDPPNTCNSLLKRIKNKVTIDLTKRLPTDQYCIAQGMCTIC